MRIDRAASPLYATYRVVIRVDSRQRNTIYGLIIEQVTVVLDEVHPAPDPLNVWAPGPQQVYEVEPYLATYANQMQGDRLEAVFVKVPGTHVQLEPGGTDELDVQVTSKVAISLRFHVAITYRVTDQAQTHTLVLPNELSAVFTDASNWHPYTLG